MKTHVKILLVLVALVATVPAPAAPQANPPTVKIVIIDYAPKFVPRTFAELIRWLRLR